MAEELAEQLAEELGEILGFIVESLPAAGLPDWIRAVGAYVMAVNKSIDSEQYKQTLNCCSRPKPQALRMHGEFDDAFELLRELQPRHPKDFQFSKPLALCMVDSGNTEGQLEGFRVAVPNAEVYPQIAEAWDTLGWSRFQMSEYAAGT